MPGAAISRDRAFLAMTTPLGKDVLIPTALRLEEAINAPFLCVLDAVSERTSIDPDSLLYQPACVMLQPRERAARPVHGVVRRFGATGRVERGLFGYRMEIVPKLWFLSQTEDCRVFENKTTADILRTVLGENGVSFALRTGSTPARPFTVQYNESDLAFITRLIEEEGWGYFFRHEPSAHTMILTDSNASFSKVANGTVDLRSGTGPGLLSDWQAARATAHGHVMLADYDPEQPNTDLSAATDTTFATAGAPGRDPFHWPALTLKNDQIKQRTRLRLEAAEVEAALAHGTGCNEGFIAGGRIQVIDRPGGDPKEFVLCRVAHEAADETWRNAATPPTYTNTFSCFPAELPWRPRPIVPRPRMDGLYSATVIGPDGQEIHTDKLGRVKLRFRWDRRHDATAGGAIWVRVIQAWGGANSGWTFIPRVGTEVAVAFLDGDPDRPVVVGQLHNGEQLPPWSLPDEKTKSGLRTRSTPQGGEQDCSEFWFDDKKGEELVFLHAQRDLQIETERDATSTIGRNRTAMIKTGDDKLTVQNGNRTVTVPMGDHTISSKTGNISIKTEAGAICVEAFQGLTLKVGQSCVKLDQAGVTIQGMTVKIEGQMLTSLKGAITELDADALLKAAGGIVMVN